MIRIIEVFAGEMKLADSLKPLKPAPAVIQESSYTNSTHDRACRSLHFIASKKIDDLGALDVAFGCWVVAGCLPRAAFFTDLPAALPYLRLSDFREVVLFLAAIFYPPRSPWVPYDAGNAFCRCRILLCT